MRNESKGGHVQHLDKELKPVQRCRALNQEEEICEGNDEPPTALVYVVDTAIGIQEFADCVWGIGVVTSI